MSNVRKTRKVDGNIVRVRKEWICVFSSKYEGMKKEMEEETEGRKEGRKERKKEENVKKGNKK